MRFLLDSNTCIEHLRRAGSRALKRRLLSADPSDIAVSVITVFELRIGARRQGAPVDEAAVIDLFLGGLTALPLGAPAVEHAVELQTDLLGQGLRIGVFDALIAGTALANALILVTHNVQEFGRVRNLHVQDWQG